MLASVTQNCCEKYFKAIIELYVDSKTKEDEDYKTSMLRAHSLRRLMRDLHALLDIDIPRSVYQALSTIDGYYISAGYPGDSAFFVDENTMEDCKVALKECVPLVNNAIIDLFLRKNNQIVNGMRCLSYRFDENAFDVLLSTVDDRIKIKGEELQDSQGIPDSLLKRVTFYCEE